MVVTLRAIAAVLLGCAAVGSTTLIHARGGAQGDGPPPSAPTPAVPTPVVDAVPGAVRRIESGMRLPTPRYGMPAVVIDGGIYVVGGQGPEGMLGDVVKITPATRKVETISNALLPRRYHAAAAWGRYIYVMGGVVESDAPGNVNGIVERFDTRTGEVKRLAPMPVPLRLAGAVAAGGRVFVLGGSDPDGAYKGTVAVYDIQTDTWRTGTPMPTPRECSFVLRGGRIWAVGGFDGRKAHSAVEVYYTGTDRWGVEPPLPFPLSAHHMALLGDRCYAFGDFNQPDLVAVYDFRARRWDALRGADFRYARNNPVVAVGDRLYVIGGNKSAASGGTDDVQEFAPVGAAP